jgi:hypothetical protein
MDDLDEIIDKLYALTPDEFTSARNEAARELRKARERDAADRVKALRRPSAAAGAVNRLVRGHRDDVEAYLRAAAALRDAQFAGKGDLGGATRKMQETLARLTGVGGEQVRQSLLAASVDDEAARQLLEARLEKELEPRGFGTLLAYAPSSPVKLEAPAPRAKPEPTTRTEPEAKPRSGLEAKPAAARRAEAPAAPADAPAPVAPTRKSPQKPEPRRPDDGAARARLADARDALRAAEAEEEQARRHWEQTRREAEKARAAVDEAQDDLDRLRGD